MIGIRQIMRGGWVIALLMVSACAQGAGSGAGFADRQAFPTATGAVDALIAANRSNDKNSIIKILGPGAEKLVTSGDPVADKSGREHFVHAYDAAHELDDDGGNKKVLVVGEEKWPMPIPLVHYASGWQFDTAKGAEEILNRRIGRNEMHVIQICRAYVEAQYEYADIQRARHGHREFAQHILSKPGTHDGLYWPVKGDAQESPLGPLIAQARAEGYPAGSHHTPYHGYYYRILKAQGPDASGGAIEYIKGGHMTKGFALIAFPARYGDSGVMTFIINQNGIVYEKDLGRDTLAYAYAIKVYNPGSGWRIAK